ncbi:MAG: DUF4091 domain-containing protein [Candidatus Thermoplasmatota archaeon]|nr:DUF4091 domain-containing protein [Candidatus Thermoplasmatota archaeon]
MNPHLKDVLILILTRVLIGLVIVVLGGVVFYEIRGMAPQSKPDDFQLQSLNVEAVVQKDELFSNDNVKYLPGQLSDGFSVYAASSLDRIFLNGKTLVKPSFSDSPEVSLAKNEYESFQIVINNGKSYLGSVRFEISDLMNDDGVKFNKENISYRIVGYVPTRKPIYPVKYVGLWPDPLMPSGDIDIQSGEMQPFWFTVFVPKDAVAGEYNGVIKVVVKGNVLKEIPLSVKIFDFELPRESNLKTAFGFDPSFLSKYYTKDVEATEEQFLIEMIKHKMNPILYIDPTSKEDLEKVDKYRWFGFNNFAVGKFGGGLRNNWPEEDVKIEELLQKYQLYGEALALNKMLNYQYVYTWDEGEIGNPVVAKIASMVHRAYPKLKNMVCYKGFWDPEEYPGWGKDIDTWCFQIDHFNLKKLNALKKIGMEMWMYVSRPGNNQTPNLAIDFDSTDYRIIPWMCWKYNLKGFLYWCTNWFKYVDPYKDADNTFQGHNGNGLLYYPGKSGPVSSLRAEIFRDGVEDYEYLFLLRDRLRAFRNKGMDKTYPKIFQRSIKLLMVDNNIVKSTTEYAKDGEILKTQRNRIGQAIEELNVLLNKQKLNN